MGGDNEQAVGNPGYAVALGLGSNRGDREAYLRLALGELARSVSGLRVSSFHETPALLPEGAPAEWDVPFLNMAAVGETSLSPDELLSEVKRIEREVGRVASGHWGPREIDIDILLYGDESVDAPHLRIPHAHLHSRAFALAPLVEIAPGWRYPCGEHGGKTMRELLDQLQGRERRTKLVGILNLTPDSFSDGGMNVDVRASARRLIAEGASILDVGAESTRPGATPLSAAEEWARLSPFFEVWPEFRGSVTLSVDTRHPETVRRALEHGAEWINDVGGFADPAMVEAVRGAECRLVVMHSLTVPADPAVTLPPEVDVIAELLRFFTARAAALEAEGIRRARLIFDPGIGFGKTAAQSWEIVRRVAELRVARFPLLFGHSRKSFLGGSMEARDAASLEVSRALIRAGVEYLRVHNISAHAGITK